jgi:hypothetical protein
MGRVFRGAVQKGWIIATVTLGTNLILFMTHKHDIAELS